MQQRESLAGRVLLLRRRRREGLWWSLARASAVVALSALLAFDWVGVGSGEAEDVSFFKNFVAASPLRLSLCGLVGAQLLLALVSLRSLRVKRFLCFAKTDLVRATHAFVAAGPDGERAQLLPLERLGDLEGRGVEAFALSLSGVRYLCLRGDGVFEKVECPERLPVEAYARTRGLVDDAPAADGCVSGEETSEGAKKKAGVRAAVGAGAESGLAGSAGDSLRAARAAHGPNCCQVGKVSFGSIFAKQVQSPFFLFQVFSISLWLLDEYWAFPLTSLFLIVLVEAQVFTLSQGLRSHLDARGRRVCARVPQRDASCVRAFLQQSFKTWRDVNRVRAMAPLATRVYVHRRRARGGGCFWKRVSSHDLCPGDVFLLARDNAPAPADCVLIRGNALVDESTLTGKEKEVQEEEEGAVSRAFSRAGRRGFCLATADALRLAALRRRVDSSGEV